jgi:hypothetical protein
VGPWLANIGLLAAELGADGLRGDMPGCNERQKRLEPAVAVSVMTVAIEPLVAAMVTQIASASGVADQLPDGACDGCVTVGV